MSASPPSGSGEHGSQDVGMAERDSFDESLADTGELRRYAGDVALHVNNYDYVADKIHAFMYELYGQGRYEAHNERLLNSYERYSRSETGRAQSQATIDIDKTAIILHDFVDHAILEPQRTARRTGRDAEDIKRAAISLFNELADEVGNTNNFIKSYLFAIDASKWESAAQIWRAGANKRIDDMVERREIEETRGDIMKAAVNKDERLDSMDQAELETVLKSKTSLLLDLKLDAISQGSLNHNIKGLFLKGLETLDLIEHPAPNNPASAWRDCTEALNFFVPALRLFGYKELAADLRGAALKWLVDDPHGYAKEQYDLASSHYDAIVNTVSELREREFGGYDIQSEARLKTEGSIRSKLAIEGYNGLQVVPDGVGFTFVVPDDMSHSEMKQFAEDYRNSLTTEQSAIASKHPISDDEAFEEKDNKTSGYKAFHITFYYYPEAGNDELFVPFEIQVMTQEQYRLKLYGASSDLFYKAGTSATPEDVNYLRELERRGYAEREMAPGSTIESIAEMVAVSPEIPSVFNELFSVIDTSDGARLLVPHNLAEISREILENSYGVLGDAGDLTILPPTHVSEAQFLEALDMFSSDLGTDKNVLSALSWVKNTEGARLRNDNVTTVLEGHLLPTALSATMLAMQSGKIWDSDDSPDKYMSNVTTIALLHDFVEAEIDGYKQQHTNTRPSELLKKRDEVLNRIRRKFGGVVAKGVAAITSPPDIEDTEIRRDVYAATIRSDDYARIVKPADRWQNHITDIVELAFAQLGPDERRRKLAYFAKTDRHLSADFISDDMPEVYRRAHRIMWEYARHFGYEQVA